MSCRIWRADGEPSGSCRLQAQMLHVGLEVAVAEQQRQVGLDAGGGDDPVDPLGHCDHLAAQLRIVLRRCPGVAAAENFQQGQGRSSCGHRRT